MEFKVLGRFQAINGGRICTPSAPKVRQILATLVLHANQVIAQDDLIEEIWGGDIPKSAVTTIHTHVHHLRKAIGRELGVAESDEMLVTTPPGYLLQLDEDRLDLARFDRLFDEGRDALANDDPERAAGRLRQALGLWDGPALANVRCGHLLESRITHLEERRTTALEFHVTAELRLGKSRELLPELKMLVKANPFNEWLSMQLIAALNETGRRVEALQTYQEVRRLLKNELGLDPSVDLQRTHQAVLASGSPRAGHEQLDRVS